MRDKPIISAENAAQLVQDGWNPHHGRLRQLRHPYTRTRALARRFASEAQPCDLTLVFAAGQGDKAGKGLNLLAHRGLLKKPSAATGR